MPLKTAIRRLRRIWNKMVRRCHDSNDDAFFKYGERGVTVCEEWRFDFRAFAAWSLSHGYADDLTIDRIEAGKGYAPDNCRWATGVEQTMNRRVVKTTSRHVGVRRHYTGLFEARIRFGGKRRQLGYFKTEDAAGEAYRTAFRELHGMELSEVRCPVILK